MSDTLQAPRTTSNGQTPTSFADLGKEMWSYLTGKGAAINYDGTNSQAVMTRRLTETARPLRAVRSAVPEGLERAVRINSGTLNVEGVRDVVLELLR